MQTQLNNLRGKYIKTLLLQLEQYGLLTQQLRKIVLDHINDYAREVNDLLGYNDES